MHEGILIFENQVTVDSLRKPAERVVLLQESVLNLLIL